MRLKVLVADDHDLVRQNLRNLLEQAGISVIGEASNGKAAVHLARKLRPDVAVLDLRMPLMNGIEAAQRILRNSPKTKTIILTIHGEVQYVQAAFQAGVRGYILKTRAPDELLAAISLVYQGKLYLAPHLALELLDTLLTRTQVVHVS